MIDLIHILLRMDYIIVGHISSLKIRHLQIQFKNASIIYKNNF
jgi:hypothetical protein